MDRAFWREVATVGGLVAVVGGVVAVLAGFTDHPSYTYGWILAVSGGGLAVVAGILSGFLARRPLKEEPGKPKG